MREGFRRLSYLTGATAFGGWLYLFFSQSPAANADDFRVLGDMFGISPTNVAFRLTCIIGTGLIFFVVGAALTRFVGWVAGGFVSNST
jgi:hypothetical protein